MIFFHNLYEELQLQMSPLPVSAVCVLTCYTTVRTFSTYSTTAGGS